MTATFTPAAEASTAARKPAPLNRIRETVLKTLGTLMLLCLATHASAVEAWSRTALLQSCKLSTTLTGTPTLVGIYRINDFTFERYFPADATGCPERIAFD